jgi:hypothetical protein
MQTVGTEIEWDLGEVVPAVRACLTQPASDDVSSVHDVTKLAPTRRDPVRPRWVERAPVISRLITIYDRLRDSR